MLLLIILATFLKCVYPLMNGADSTNDWDVQVVKIDFGNSTICTGSIVGNFKSFNLILTAAHCFEDDEDQESIIDQNHQKNYLNRSISLIYSSESTNNTQIVIEDFVSQVLIHPDYTIAKQRKYDLALIITNRKLFNYGLSYNPFLAWKSINQFYRVGCVSGTESEKVQEFEVNRDNLFEIDDQFVIYESEKNGSLCSGDSGAPLASNESSIMGIAWGSKLSFLESRMAETLYVDLLTNEWFREMYVNLLFRNATIDELVTYINQNLTEWFRHHSSLMDSLDVRKKVLFNLISEVEAEKADELLEILVEYNYIGKKSLESSKNLLTEIAKTRASMNKLSKVVHDLNLNEDLAFVEKLGLILSKRSQANSFDGVRFMNMFNMYSIDGVIVSLIELRTLESWFNYSQLTLPELGYAVGKFDQNIVVTRIQTNESKSINFLF